MAKELTKRREKEKEQGDLASKASPVTNGSKVAATRKRPTGGNKFTHWPVFCKFVAVLLFIYYCGMMVTRYQYRGYYAFVDTLWVCNLNLLIASAGILLHSAELVAATINSVFIAHVLWVVDVISYLITGDFPIGLAAYVAWPETSWAELISSTHHMWFIPLLLMVLHKNGGFPFKSWLIAVSMIFPIQLISLCFPEEIILSNGEPYYLNVNMAHGWWRDMNGWPWSLIPKQNPQYQLFLNTFIATQFTVAFFLVRLVAGFVIKPR